MSFVLAAIAYLFTAWAVFGGILSPLAFLTEWSDRLGAPYWGVAVLSAILISSLVFMPPLRKYILQPFRLAIFTALSLILSVLFVGAYADWLRHRIVDDFGADHIILRSFFASIREAPDDFQFFLHAVALKDCQPYAWSYREMAFYALEPNVAANVLPAEWRAMCSIQRSSSSLDRNDRH